MPSTIRARNKSSREFENANIKNAVNVPACDISKTGFLPILSLILPQIGAETKVKTAFVASKKPITNGVVLNTSINVGKNGIMM